MNVFPLGLARGGKEDQLNFVVDIAKSIFSNSDDLNLASDFHSGSILHCFGDSPHFYSTYRFLRGQNKKAKLVISPNFYRRPAHYYWLSRALSSLGPNWWTNETLCMQLQKK